MANNYTGIPIIDKAAIVLGCILTSPQGVAAATLLKKVKIPKTTFYRILNSLVKNGFLFCDEGNGLYYPGNLFNPSSKLDDNRINILKEKCFPFLQNLVNEVQETAKLSILSNMDCLVLSKVEGFANLRISVDTGALFPLHAGASSKLLLSTLGPDGIHRYFSKPVDKFTPYTIVTEEDMLIELQRIKRSGCSIDHGEYIEGIGAVACPITDADHHIIAAVSIAYPILPTVNEKIQTLLPPLSECANCLSNIW